MSLLTNLGFELAKMIAAGLIGMALAGFLTRRIAAELENGNTPKYTLTRVTGGGLAVLSVLSLATLTSAERDQSERASCQIKFNEAFALSLTVSRESAEQERLADDADRAAEHTEREAFAVLLQAVQAGEGADAVRTYERVLSASEEVRRKTETERREAREKRRASPFPSVPDCDGKR